MVPAQPAIDIPNKPTSGAPHHMSTPTATAPQVAINDIGTAEDFLAAIDLTIKYFNDGDIVEGTIVKVDRDEVLLDIGYKTEGVIPSRELSIKHDVDPSEVVSIGEHVEALVLQLEDKRFDVLADRDDLTGVDIVLDGQLTRGDDTFGLVADVEQNLVAVDLDDRALDDVAIVEVLDGQVDGCEEVLSRPDVVDGDLWGGGGRGGHVVGCSGSGFVRNVDGRLSGDHLHSVRAARSGPVSSRRQSAPPECRARHVIDRQDECGLLHSETAQTHSAEPSLRHHHPNEEPRWVRGCRRDNAGRAGRGGDPRGPVRPGRRHPRHSGSGVTAAMPIGPTRPRRIGADQSVSRAANRRWWDRTAWR